MRQIHAATPLLALPLALAFACTTGEVIEPVKIVAFTAAPASVGAGGSVTLAWEVTGPVTGVRVTRAGMQVASSQEAKATQVVDDVPAGQLVFVLEARGLAGDVQTAEATASALSAPAVIRFAATPEAVPASAPVLLAWTTARAEQIELFAGTTLVATKAGEAAAAGSVPVTPAASTEYRLVATGPGGTTEAAVTVSVLPPPTVDELTISPAVVAAGQPVTVQWKTSRASRVDLREGAVALRTAEGAQAEAGSFEWTPAMDATVMLEATGAGGIATKSVTVTVQRPPLIESFAADARGILAGEKVVLSWTVAGAESLELTANGAPVEAELSQPAGTLEQAPAGATVYELTATNAHGTARASIPIEVFGAVLVDTFEADKTSILRGREAVTLTWKVSGASTITISNDEGDALELGSRASDAEGTVVVSPESATAYTLTAIGPAGSAKSAPVSIAVETPAPLVEPSLSRETIPLRQAADLSWHILDATEFTISWENAVGETGTIDTQGKALDDGLQVRPLETTTYTFVATGPGGTTEKSITLSVQRPPRIRSFTVPEVVTKGAKYRFEWEALDAYAVSLVDLFTSSTSILYKQAGTYGSIAGLEGTQEVTMDHDVGYADIDFPEDFAYPFPAEYNKGTSISYRSLAMAADGYVCFGGPDQCSTGTSPNYVYQSYGTNSTAGSTTRPNSYIAGFWDDLLGNAQTHYLWRIDGTAPDRRMTFEWKDTDFKSATANGARLNFQVVLYENGHWQSKQAPREQPTINLGDNNRWGLSATIGIEGIVPVGTTSSPTARLAYNSGGLICMSYTAGAGSNFGQCSPARLLQPVYLPAKGSFELTAPTGTTPQTLRIRAYGPLGVDVSTDRIVRFVSAVTLKKYEVNRSHVGRGEAVKLAYDVDPDDAGTTKTIQKMTLKANDAVTDLTGQPKDQVLTFNPTSTTTYTFKAINEAGDGPEGSVEVKVGPPVVSLAIDKTEGPANDTKKFVFSWTTSGATKLVLRAPDGSPVPGFPAYDWYAGDGAARTAMAKGTFAYSPPPGAGGTYTLEATNGVAGEEETASASVEINLLEDLRLFDVRVVDQAGKTIDNRATAGGKVFLAWQTFNATQLVIANDATGAELARIEGASAAAQLRDGSRDLVMPASDTTFVLTATAADGTTKTVKLSVQSVAPAAIGEFSVNPNQPTFNADVAVRWATTGATALQIEVLSAFDAAAPPAYELTSARDKASGTLSLRATRPTMLRLTARNELGTPTVETRGIQPQVETPGISLSVDPDKAPKGGFANLTWSSTQADRVYLWKQGTATGDNQKLQIPVDAVPYGFVDVSAVGQELAFTRKNGTTITEDLSAGVAVVTLPSDFRPDVLGDTDITGLAITADGSVTYTNVPNPTIDNFACNGVGTGTTNTCTSTTQYGSTIPAVTSGTSSVAKGYLSPVGQDLAACSGWTSTSGCPEDWPAGKAHFAVVGTKPDRVAIAQWTNWDFSSTTNASTLTFEVKLFENGDIEYQYKTFRGKFTSSQVGTSATVALESLDEKTGYELDDFTPRMGDGIGWRFYSGNQAYKAIAQGSVNATGRVRTFLTDAVSSVYYFRAVGSNLTGTEVKDAKSIGAVAGVGDLLVNKILFDPTGNDEGKEWIELRNTTTADIPLTGYTLEFSNGQKFTFSGTQIVPKSSVSNGLAIIGQSIDPAVNGNVDVKAAYGNLSLDNTADAVILRYGPVLIDRVEYDVTQGWPRPPENVPVVMHDNVTASAQAFNDLPQLWCASRATPPAGTLVAAPSTPCHYFERFEPDFGETNLAADATALDAISPSVSGNVRTAVIPIGFDFPYFGQRYSELWVGDDGYASFGGGTATGSNASSLPSTTGHVEGLFVFWDDLDPLQADPANPGRLLYKVIGEGDERALVVQWSKYRFYKSSNGSFGELDLRLVLRANGGIEYHYAKLDAGTGTDAHRAGASSATIGLEAFGDSLAIDYHSETGGAATTPQLPSTSPFGLRLVRAR